MRSEVTVLHKFVVASCRHLHDEHKQTNKQKTIPFITICFLQQLIKLYMAFFYIFILIFVECDKCFFLFFFSSQTIETIC